nr:uncharacterized protein LOC117692332 isoform X3 [Crassostrea gigas]
MTLHHITGICRKCRRDMYEAMKVSNMLNIEFCCNDETSFPNFNVEVKPDVDPSNLAEENVPADLQEYSEEESELSSQPLS